MTSAPDARRVAGASSSRKLLHTLLCFTERRPTWTVADLAAELGLSTASAYRYVGLLREVGLLDHAGDSSYRLTDLVVGLARANEAAQLPLAQAALPAMTRLRDEIDETVLIARRGGHAAYCVERVESPHPIRLRFDRGEAMTLHAGALARVLLAHMPTADRTRYLADVLPGLPAERAAALSPGALDEIVTAGWTESFEEIDEGVWGCAAAVRAGGTTVAALGTAAPTFRTGASQRARMSELVRAAAEEVSAALA